MPPKTEILRKIRLFEEQGYDNPFDRVRRHYMNEMYKKEERDLILYSTSWTVSGGGVGTSINESDVHSFMDVIHGLDGDKLDVIIHSPGGSPTATEQIVSYLRNKFSDIRIFVPQSAMSAATLMCCAADRVVMGSHSSLGPIDPQMHLPTTPRGHSTAAFAVLDQFEMASSDIETYSDLTVWKPILDKIDPGTLAECSEAIELSKTLAREWAKEYMHGNKKNADKLSEKLAEFLSNRRAFKSHSRRIDRSQASKNGFEVEELEQDDTLQDLVLSIFHSTMLAHENTELVKIIENQNGRNSMVVNSG
jgi:hypothetical protein